MSTYAILNAERTAVLRTEQYDDAWYAQAVAAGSPKVLTTLPLIVDPLPALTAAQKAVPGAFAIELAQSRVRQTWLVVDKTAAELDAQTDVDELAVLQQMVAALKAGTGTAAERLQRVERVCVWLLKQAVKRGVL